MVSVSTQMGRLHQGNWKKQEAEEKGTKWEKDTVANSQDGETFLRKNRCSLGFWVDPVSTQMHRDTLRILFAECFGVFWYEIGGRQPSWYMSRCSDGRARSSFHVLLSVTTAPSHQHSKPLCLVAWKPWEQPQHSPMLAAHPCLGLLAEHTTLRAGNLFFWQNCGKRSLYEMYGYKTNK